MESMFKNRVKKNFDFLKKWAKRGNITAYRVYDKDIPQYPYTVDFYDGSIVIYQYESLKYNHENNEEYLEKDIKKLEEVIISIKNIFQIDEDNIFLKKRKKQKGILQYEKEIDKKITKIVTEGDMKFIVNLSDYIDCGLFLDHRKTRQLVKNLAFDNNILNLFSYTGSVSVAAALGKAKSVTSVDMSNTYLNWAEENFKLNNISLHNHEFIREDITKWLPEIALTRKKFDFIFIDPPSFSNSKKMQELFDIQKDYIKIINNSEKILSTNGKIIFSCNLRSFKFTNEFFNDKFLIEDISLKTIPQDFRNSKIHYTWMLRKKISN